MVGRDELGLDLFRTRLGKIGQIEARREVRFWLGLSVVEVARLGGLRGRFASGRRRIQRSKNLSRINLTEDRKITWSKVRLVS